MTEDVEQVLARATCRIVAAAWVEGLVSEESPGAFDTSSAMQRGLIDEVKKLAEALEWLRGGGGGICEECGNPITPARLRAVPEVTTCLRCQGRLEPFSTSTPGGLQARLTDWPRRSRAGGRATAAWSPEARGKQALTNLPAGGWHWRDSWC